MSGSAGGLALHRRAARPGAAAALAACAMAALGGSCGVNPKPKAASLATLVSLLAEARLGDPEALEYVAPAGTRLSWLSDPYTPGASVNQDDASAGIVVMPSFVEGRPAAYGVTEYWEQFPEVWAQPLYILVTGFDAATGAPRNLSPFTAVFAVGTQSRFYSSYWQIYYALVPAGADPGDYTSEKKIFDSGVQLVKGALTFCALAPTGTNLAHEKAAGGATPAARHPLTGLPIPLRGATLGWVEDEYVWFVDFGRNRYRIDEHQVVQPEALFRFAVRDPADGSARELGLPTVGGTGPRGDPRPAVVVQGVPQFGTLWHEYTVLLNPPNPSAPGAAQPPAPFIPRAASGLRALIAGNAGGGAYGALFTPLPDPASEAAAAGNGASLADYTLRVALNPQACFVDPNPAFPAGPCLWLDSQRAIEGSIAAPLITDAGRLSSCPLVVYDGKAVP